MTTNSDEVIDCSSSGSAPIVFSKDDDDNVWDDRELIEQYNNAINIAYKTVGAAVVDNNNPKTKKKVNRKQQLLSQSQESQGYTGYTDPVMPSPIPRIAPPPPPGFAHLPPPSEQSALSSMLMSWYMSGYHTGYYQAQQDLKEKATTAHCYNTQEEEELGEDEEYTDPR